jgi:hypothetical protein
MNTQQKLFGATAARALLAAAVSVASIGAQAGADFSGYPAYASRMVYCDRPDVRGTFLVQESRYVARGTCVLLEAVQPATDKNDIDTNRSQFADYNHSKELFRAEWTAEGGYNPLTKQAWEKIVIPPILDHQAPAGRPYGRFESKMFCSDDPWIAFGSSQCTAIKSTATGSLGDLEKPLRQISRPFTSFMKLAQQQALYDEHETFLKRSAAMAPKNTTVAKEALRTVTLPEILEPRPASTHPPQTPLKIRVAPPRNIRVQSYELQFETKQPNGSWQVQTNVRVTAAEVEGPLGYKGWGWHQPGTGLQMTASAGAYRLRARAVNPDQGEAGAWQEFTIAGDPGPGPDVMSKSNVLSGLGHGVASPEPARAPTPSAVANPRSAMAGQGAAPATSKAPPQKAASSFDASGRPATLDWSKAAPSAYAPQPLQRSQP